MDDKANNTSSSLLVRLGAFIIVLALGFAMGFFNGQNKAFPTDVTTSGLVSTYTGTDDGQATSSNPYAASLTIDEDGWYTSKEEVALYLHTYGHLPSNFISKSKARKRGWVPELGNFTEVCPGMSIGGGTFYNNDGKLPDKQGRSWRECDINYRGRSRGAERIVYSNDGLIFYTPDHYVTFEQLY